MYSNSGSTLSSKSVVGYCAYVLHINAFFAPVAIQHTQCPFQVFLLERYKQLLKYGDLTPTKTCQPYLRSTRPGVSLSLTGTSAMSLPFRLPSSVCRVQTYGSLFAEALTRAFNTPLPAPTQISLSADLTCGFVVPRALTSVLFDTPTTAVRKGNSLYAVNAKFGVAEEDVPTTEYEIVRVDRDSGEYVCTSV